MLALDCLSLAKNLDKPLSVFLAVQFAEKALPIWEGKYPDDIRPRRAIEAAREWLDDPSDANQSDIADARAAYAARGVGLESAAYTAATAAYVAAYVADATYLSTVGAAIHAAKALETDKENLIHEVILENLDWILRYKIDNEQSFAKPELILDYLNEEQKQRFLFNLDRVV